MDETRQNLSCTVTPDVRFSDVLLPGHAKTQESVYRPGHAGPSARLNGPALGGCRRSGTVGTSGSGSVPAALGRRWFWSAIHDVNSCNMLFTVITHFLYLYFFQGVKNPPSISRFEINNTFSAAFKLNKSLEPMVNLSDKQVVLNPLVPDASSLSSVLEADHLSSMGVKSSGCDPPLQSEVCFTRQSASCTSQLLYRGVMETSATVKHLWSPDGATMPFKGFGPGHLDLYVNDLVTFQFVTSANTVANSFLLSQGCDLVSGLCALFPVISLTGDHDGAVKPAVSSSQVVSGDIEGGSVVAAITSLTGTGWPPGPRAVEPPSPTPPGLWTSEHLLFQHDSGDAVHLLGNRPFKSLRTVLCYASPVSQTRHKFEQQKGGGEPPPALRASFSHFQFTTISDHNKVASVKLQPNFEQVKSGSDLTITPSASLEFRTEPSGKFRQVSLWVRNTRYKQFDNQIAYEPAPTDTSKLVSLWVRNTRFETLY
ncbi:uncharacterized protein [Nothobranchius furzeri]|uniref:uncharacterized protein n=1 Tax=Nothobranchius furzeri TaxID=105023 RepID=UPI003904D4BD